MEKVYLNSLPERIEEAIKNNMPYESKLVFVGELTAAYFSGVISIKEEEELLAKLGFTRKELFKYTDFVTFGELQDEDY